jgi:hypothetical protein
MSHLARLVSRMRAVDICRSARVHENRPANVLWSYNEHRQQKPTIAVVVASGTMKTGY